MPTVQHQIADLERAILERRQRKSPATSDDLRCGELKSLSGRGSTGISIPSSKGFNPGVGICHVVSILTIDCHTVALVKITTISELPIVIITPIVHTTWIGIAASTASTNFECITTNCLAHLARRGVIEVTTKNRETICSKSRRYHLHRHRHWGLIKL